MEIAVKNGRVADYPGARRFSELALLKKPGNEEARILLQIASPRIFQRIILFVKEVKT
jgi:hypothetical protein